MPHRFIQNLSRLRMVHICAFIAVIFLIAVAAAVRNSDLVYVIAGLSAGWLLSCIYVVYGVLDPIDKKTDKHKPPPEQST